MTLSRRQLFALAAAPVVAKAAPLAPGVAVPGAPGNPAAGIPASFYMPQFEHMKAVSERNYLGRVPMPKKRNRRRG